MLRSGKELDEPTTEPQQTLEEKTDMGKEFDKEDNRPEKDNEKEKIKKKSEEIKSNSYVPPVPFPQRLQKAREDKQFSKFLEVFKKLQVNIPFADALAQMPSYVKFMKKILSRKKRLEDFETVALTEECSAILQKKLPPKLKDPGSFTIPCTIGKQFVGHALCDLGASINLMPLSIYQKLGLKEAKPTNVTLQLADRSVTYPRGIIEDVLVKVDKLILPADFLVLDYEEDENIPIILGRPFLATGRTIIDVQKGELTMKVEDQEVKFHVFKPMKLPDDTEKCFQITTIKNKITDMEEERGEFRLTNIDGDGVKMLDPHSFKKVRLYKGRINKWLKKRSLNRKFDPS